MNRELLDEKERVLKQLTDAKDEAAEASLVLFCVTPTLRLTLDIA
jgi:hypothetical protein